MTKMINGNSSINTPVTVNFNFLKNVATAHLEAALNDKSTTAQQIAEALQKVIDLVDPLLDVVNRVSQRADSYNFSDEIKGNGYSSWVKNTHMIVEKCTKVLEEMSGSKCSYYFRKEHYLKEIIAYGEALESFQIMLSLLLTLMSWCDEGDLFLRNGKLGNYDLLRTQRKFINQECFYGRCVGFQFNNSLSTVAKAIIILMASFSEVYYSSGRIIDPIIRGSKYWIDPELRGKRIVNISSYASVNFCKNFWFLSEMELMHHLPNIVLPSLPVNMVFSIEPETLIIQNIYGKDIDVPIPSSHGPPRPVSVRLLSSCLRLGMEIESSSKSGYKFPSDALVFHCHGGGFVAQSSKSHDSYLRHWAKDLDVPILSIDYSLAPEAPHPRANEEIFYCYCWVLKNASKLGFTGEKIILAGDSAGANLNLGLTLMCLEYGVRPPHGVFLAYGPTLGTANTSPSRLLCFTDPLLPFGFLINCLKAYTGAKVEGKEEITYVNTSHEWRLRRSINKCQESRPDSVVVENGNEACSEASEKADDQFSKEDDDIEAKQELMPRSESTGIISRWVESFSNKFIPFSPSKSFSNSDEEENVEEPEDLSIPFPIDLVKFETENNIFLSPYMAADSMIANFPPVSLLTTDLDPFLDDNVQFAKKLRHLGVNMTLDILPGLVHGFLNFAMVSSEAAAGSKKCVERIKNLINSNCQEPTSAQECFEGT